MANPSGPFSVGVVDLDWTHDGKKPNKPSEPGVRSVSWLRPDEHLTGRLFYPTPKVSSGWFRGPSRVRWMPHWNYAAGFTHFLFAWARGQVKYQLTRAALTPALYAVGSSQMLDCYENVPVATPGVPFPVVIMSHGIGGTRTAYSATCAEVASQGYVVLAVEHADGSGSTCRLAHGGGWLFYEGWPKEEEIRMAQTRFRMAEVLMGYKLLQHMQQGQAIPGMELSNGASPADFLRGHLDMEAAALMGHSYGGATVTALCAHEPLFKCTVALDPWWAALMADQAALKRWETQSPLLIMGSQQWHTPDKNGNIYAGGARQKQIQQSASHRQTNGSATAPGGGGSVLLVLEGSTHDSFTDVLPLFSERFGRIIRLIGFKGGMDPALGMNMITRSILAFLNRHLPLTEGQRAFYQDHPLPAHENGSKHKDKAVAASKGQLTSENSATANGASSQQSTSHSNGQPSAADHEPASGARSCLPYVTADEKQVFESIAEGHIAKLEVVP